MTKNRVVLTSSALDLHNELKEDLLQDFPKIYSSRAPLKSSKAPAETFQQTFFVPKAGYFGPKPDSGLRGYQPVSGIYPNYLKRDPKEYAAVHCCSWRPKSTVKGRESNRPMVPKIKHIHHTLFDSEKHKSIDDHPSVPYVNKLVYKGGLTIPLNLISNETINAPDIQSADRNYRLSTYGSREGDNSIDEVQFTERTLQSKAISQLSNGSRSYRNHREVAPVKTALRSSRLKTERILEKHSTDQNAYIEQQMKIDSVIRVRSSKDLETKKRYEDYGKAMKEGSDIMESLDRGVVLGRERHLERIRSWHEKLHGPYRRDAKGLMMKDKSESEVSRVSVSGYKVGNVSKGEGQVKTERGKGLSVRTKKNLSIIRGYGAMS